MPEERAPRGTRKDPVLLGWAVNASTKARLEAVAKRVGVTRSVFVDRLVERMELDPRGIPVWWDYPLPSDQEELPIGDL